MLLFPVYVLFFWFLRCWPVFGSPKDNSCFVFTQSTWLHLLTGSNKVDFFLCICWYACVYLSSMHFFIFKYFFFLVRSNDVLIRNRFVHVCVLFIWFDHCVWIMVEICCVCLYGLDVGKSLQYSLLIGRNELLCELPSINKLHLIFSHSFTFPYLPCFIFFQLVFCCVCVCIAFVVCSSASFFHFQLSFTSNNRLYPIT